MILTEKVTAKINDDGKKQRTSERNQKMLS
jgi:hypothetical protein